MTIIENHVEDAKARGANILVGGRRSPDLSGLYYEPTVMTDVTHDMDIMQHETFGPILCIQKVADEEEAIRLANDSEYGLNGNVWTNDKERGALLAAQIDTGSASVNDMACSYGIPAAPFGGRKASGVGQVNGEAGLKGYCHAMPIVIDKSTGDKPGSAFPHTLEKAEGMKKLMNIIWLKTPIGRWLS
jgi:succinate-semialdehyde dehydrogenase/glutarate-semialdehyde dehydrogenase